MIENSNIAMGSRPVGTWPPTKQRATHITRRDVVVLNDAKGGDMAEWPADIRVREFPVQR